MKLYTPLALAVAKRVPRGYWRIIKWVAKRDASLHNLALPLVNVPGGVLIADLREPVYTGIFRMGVIPHQVGEDIVCRKFIRPGDLVFDVGANVGYTALLFAHLSAPNGRVVAIEPAPRAYRLLTRATAHEPNITCLNLAVSSASGEVDFYEADSLDLSSVNVVAGAVRHRVRAVPLDQLVAEHGSPAFVKIDVEGFEASVLSGMAGLLRTENPPVVLFEALNAAVLEESVATIEQAAPGVYSVDRVTPAGELVPLHRAGNDNYLARPATLPVI